MIKFSATLLATLIAASVNAATVDLRIMETTDLHSNMMDFDYYKDTATEKFGLVRTASLINDARNEVKNSVLVDNGDLIQGSPLADYMSAKGLKAGDIHPVYKALNTLDYTVGTLGNHEFNYGLDYLTFITGAYTTPKIGLPWSMSAMLTVNSPLRLINSLVPSSGSTSQ